MPTADDLNIFVEDKIKYCYIFQCTKIVFDSSKVSLILRNVYVIWSVIWSNLSVKVMKRTDNCLLCNPFSSFKNNIFITVFCLCLKSADATLFSFPFWLKFACFANVWYFAIFFLRSKNDFNSVFCLCLKSADASLFSLLFLIKNLLTLIYSLRLIRYKLSPFGAQKCIV